MEIDVSKCKYWQMAHCPEGYTCKYNCCDCYYKQLQQLKQELQAYKDKVKPVTFVDSDEYLKVVVENKQLKVENEELKEQYKLAEPLFQACRIKDLKIDKYKQCLDMIEKIIEKKCNKCKFNKSFCKDCVLQKIKQAKED